MSRMSWTFGGRLFAAGLQAIVIVALARAFELPDYGLFVIVFSATMGVLSVGDLGLGSVALRIGTDAEKSSLLGFLFRWRVISTLGTVLVAGTLAAWNTEPLIVLAALYAACEFAGDTSALVLQSERRSSAASLSLVLRRLAAVTPFGFGISAETATASMLVSIVSGLVTFIVVVGQPAGAPMPYREYLGRFREFVVMGFGRNLAVVDSAVVGAAGGSQIAAYYGASVRLLAPINLLTSSLTQIVIPEIRTAQNDRRALARFKRGSRWVWGFAAFLTLLSGASPEFVVIVFGSAFEEASPLMAAVLVSAALSAIAQYYLSWFIADELPKIIARGAVAFSGVGLFGLFLASHVWGIYGCAAVLIGWRLGNTMLIYFVWRARVRSAEIAR